jgi:hypothetical protein
MARRCLPAADAGQMTKHTLSGCSKISLSLLFGGQVQYDLHAYIEQKNTR